MIWVVGGTSECRLISAFLREEKMPFCLSVATELGRETYGGCADNLIVARLDQAGFEKAFIEGGIDCVIDASHPHALEVSKAVKAAAKTLGLPYCRYERPTDQALSVGLDSDVGLSDCFYPDFESLWQALKTTTGKILVTGSKELKEAVKWLEPKRLVARVVPSEESMALCKQAGLTADQIIGMKGPFSYEMNVLLLKTYCIDHFVFKASGEVSGYQDKVQAARDCQVRPWIVKPAIDLQAECLSTIEGLSRWLSGASLK